MRGLGADSRGPAVITRLILALDGLGRSAILYETVCLVILMARVRRDRKPRLSVVSVSYPTVMLSITSLAIPYIRKAIPVPVLTH